MRLDAEYERKSVPFLSEAIRYLATCCHSRVILFGEIESMQLRVILNSPVSTGLTPRHCERSEGALNTSLRGRSEPVTSEAWWWQSREGLN